jgi:hypothetical protein
MKVYKIYCLKNPDTLEIRYIGISTQKYLSTRLAQHYFNANHFSKLHVSNWIRKIGKKPIIELIEICNENNWKEREQYWISFYNNLTNIKEGGNGIYLNRSSESIQRSAKAHEKAIVQLDENGKLLNNFNSLKEATLYIGAKSLSSICNVLKNSYGAKTAFGYQWFYLDEYINKNFKIRIPYSTKL